MRDCPSAAGNARPRRSRARRSRWPGAWSCRGCCARPAIEAGGIRWRRAYRRRTSGRSWVPAHPRSCRALGRILWEATHPGAPGRRAGGRDGGSRPCPRRAARRCRRLSGHRGRPGRWARGRRPAGSRGRRWSRSPRPRRRPGRSPDWPRHAAAGRQRRRSSRAHGRRTRPVPTARCRNPARGRGPHPGLSGLRCRRRRAPAIASALTATATASAGRRPRTFD